MELSVGVANYTKTPKSIILEISPQIKINNIIAPLEVAPSWLELGNFIIPQGKYYYSFQCEGLKGRKIDSFVIKKNSYFIITLRNDINNRLRKDSFNISIIEKSKIGVLL